MNIKNLFYRIRLMIKGITTSIDSPSFNPGLRSLNFRRSFISMMHSGQEMDPSIPWQIHHDSAFKFEWPVIRLIVHRFFRVVSIKMKSFSPQFAVGKIISKHTFGPGSFEIDCQLPKSGDLSSTFRLVADPENYTQDWIPEIVIFNFDLFSDTDQDTVKNLETDVITVDPDGRWMDWNARSFKVDLTCLDRVKIGLTWTEEKLSWYYNGMKIRELKDPEMIDQFFNQELYIVAGMNVQKYPDQKIFSTEKKSFPSSQQMIIHSIKYKS